MPIEWEPNDTIATAQPSSWIGPNGYLRDTFWGQVGEEGDVDVFRVNYTSLVTSIRLDSIGSTLDGATVMQYPGMAGEERTLTFTPSGNLTGDTLTVRVSYGSAAYGLERQIVSGAIGSLYQHLWQVRDQYSADGADWETVIVPMNTDIAILETLIIKFDDLIEIYGSNPDYTALEQQFRTIAATHNSATSYQAQIVELASQAADVVVKWNKAKYEYDIGSGYVSVDSLWDVELPEYDTAAGSEFGYLSVSGGIYAAYYPGGLVWHQLPIDYDFDLYLWGYEHGSPTSGDDTLAGTMASNSIGGLAGNDRIYGLGGNDSLYGNEGDDILEGGIGRDYLSGGLGIDRASYANAADAVVVNLTSPAENAGEAAGDRYNSIENLWGSAFDDILTGNAGANTLMGDRGNDILEGLSGNDRIFGADGNDILQGGPGADYLSGGLGADRASYANATSAITADLSNASRNTGEAAGDTYNSIEHLTGTDFADRLTGTIGINSIIAGSGNDAVFGLAGNDKLYGQDGNDTLTGGAGMDYLSGGTGSDTASYASAAARVIVSLANPAINTGEAAGDTYNSIENVTGSRFDDYVYGNGGANTLNGGVGNDIIKGYAGNDRLTGGAGSDIFVFNTALDAATNVDTITDFDAVADTIYLDDVAFKGLTAGVLAASAFKDIAIAAKGASDRIIYNSTTGNLYYDADGSGSLYGNVKFAALSGAPILTAADFVII
jgi:Ca2+-binding RTX toxin-like protein